MAGDRKAQLEAFLKDDPDDTFVLYALAMERLAAGEWGSSVAYFDRVLGIDPACVPAYQQKARAQVELGQVQQACQTLRDGLVRARQAAQFHARDKMKQLLDQLVQTAT